MPYETLISSNVTTLDGMLVYIATEIPYFSYMLLFTIFLVFTLGTYYGTKKMRGDADIFASLTVGGYVASVVGIVMTIIPGLIGIDLLIIILVLDLAFTILFLTNRER